MYNFTPGFLVTVHVMSTHVMTVQLFPPYKSCLVNSIFRGTSRKQGRSSYLLKLKFISKTTGHRFQYTSEDVQPCTIPSKLKKITSNQTNTITFTALSCKTYIQEGVCLLAYRCPGWRGGVILAHRPASVYRKS